MSSRRPQSYSELPKPENIIVVVGYPRSGNTWVTRLIGDILDSPVGGYKNANPICTEGMERPGKYYVMQLHALPDVRDRDSEAIVGARTININGLRGEKIIHVVRDPRDVAVSAMYYWDLPNIKTSVSAMANGAHPFGGSGPWDKYVDSWERVWLPQVMRIRYEKLYSDPLMCVVDYLLPFIGVSMSHDNVTKSIESQSFNAKKNQIQADGDGRPYGKNIQLKHMRKGITGDWRNHFKRSDGKLLEDYFGKSLRYYGYETDGDWWKGLPE